MACPPLLDQGGGARQMLLAEDGLLVDFCFVHTAAFVSHSHMTLQTGGGILGTHAPVGDEQLADLLVQSQLLNVSSSTLSRGQTPVVDFGNGTGTVDILKIQTVGFDNGTADSGDVGAVGVLIELKVFTCFFAMILPPNNGRFLTKRYKVIMTDFEVKS